MGCVINLKENDVNFRDSRGFTPLHLAILKNNAKLVELLLQNRGDPQIPDFLGNRPLRLAQAGGLKEIIYLLKNHVECKEDFLFDDIEPEDLESVEDEEDFFGLDFVHDEYRPYFCYEKVNKIDCEEELQRHRIFQEENYPNFNLQFIEKLRQLSDEETEETEAEEDLFDDLFPGETREILKPEEKRELLSTIPTRYDKKRDTKDPRRDDRTRVSTQNF